MIVELVLPIKRIRGMLRDDGFYFRVYRGKQVLQRCPDRSKHQPTEAEIANRKRFAETWGKRYKRGEGVKG